MISSQPVSRVVNLLTAAGYRQRETPVTVASVPFEFAALLVGADHALDLIIVIDTLTEPEVRIRQKVEGFGRAMDVVASRRPLTIVLVGPTPRAAIVAALLRVGRVLPVGTPTGLGADAFLRDALAVLLPLKVDHASESVVDPFAELRRHLEPTRREEEVAPIYAAALDGTESVQQTLRDLLLEPLEAMPKDEVV
jgi:hypothetical protein